MIASPRRNIDTMYSAEDLYNAFKAIAVNSSEGYAPTLENMQRWRWHIENADMEVHPELVFENDEMAAAKANARAFATWEEMPYQSKMKYLEIADSVPGVQLYACGSRIDGTYVDGLSSGDIRAMRRALRKPDKFVSDYDVCMDGGEIDRQLVRERLPMFADLLHHGVEKKIKIPMWDFSRLPKSEHKTAIEAYNSRQWGVLVELHETYRLSENQYCCQSDAPVREWFRWAIENKIIEA